MNNINSAEQRKNRATLVLLVVVFVLPIFIATLFSQHPEWLPGRKNHGVLVTPMRDLPDFILQDIQGNPFTKQQMGKKWSVIYLGIGPCDETCLHTLYNIRQSRLAQAANVDKVQYIYLAVNSVPSAQVIAEHPDMIVVKGSPNEFSSLLAVFQDNKTDQMPTTATVYLVDPEFRVMMKYPGDFKPKGMIKDLELIFKVR